MCGKECYRLILWIHLLFLHFTFIWLLNERQWHSDILWSRVRWIFTWHWHEKHKHKHKHKHTRIYSECGHIVKAGDPFAEVIVSSKNLLKEFPLRLSMITILIHYCHLFLFGCRSLQELAQLFASKSGHVFCEFSRLECISLCNLKDAQPSGWSDRETKWNIIANNASHHILLKTWPVVLTYSQPGKDIWKVLLKPLPAFGWLRHVLTILQSQGYDYVTWLLQHYSIWYTYTIR